MTSSKNKAGLLSRLICSAAIVLPLFLSFSCEEKEDEQPAAPALLSTSPESGVSDVSGQTLTVVFTFDQKIKCTREAQNAVSVDGGAEVESVTPDAMALTVVITALQPASSYTLTLPEGTVQGFKSGQEGSSAITFTFATVDLKPEEWEDAATAARSLGVGWNLGNTLEANSGAIDGMWIEANTQRRTSDYETAWGQPVATRELVHMVKEAGFTAMRVPVTWYPHMGDVNVSLQTVDGAVKAVWDIDSWTGYDVDPVWMARVKEVVDYVIDEGMYCILNVHHDTGEATTAWLRADEAAYAKYRERYISLWNQIATTFGSYDYHLVFESFNEMLDTKGTWNYSTDEAHGVINKWNADFVSTVRATGGNNAYRNLILNTYAASTDVKALSAFTLPSDTVQGHLLAEVHSYAPYLFAFQNDWKNLETFDSACDKEVRGIIDNVAKYLVDRGIPCVLGEYGCTSNRTEEERAKQAACYVSQASKYNIPTFYWMTLSDGEDRMVPKWSTPKIKNAIINAYNDSKQ